MKELLQDKDMLAAILLVTIWICVGTILMSLLGRQYGAMVWGTVTCFVAIWKLFGYSV